MRFPLTSPRSICSNRIRMLTTREVAKRLGIDTRTLNRYIRVKKVPPPQTIQFGGFRVHSWNEEDVERLRRLLPKIANGRKTRYQKLRETQKAPPKAAAPHKRKTKKK